MKKFLSILLAVCLVLSLASLASAQEAKTVKIGTIQALSGSSSVMGNMIEGGVDWAVELINREGGIDIGGEKYQVELIKRDSKSDVDTSITAYKELASLGCVAVVGPHQANIEIALAPVAEEVGMPMFMMGMDSRCTRRGEIGALGEPWSYMFLSQPSCDLQGAIQAKWCLEQGYKNVAVLYRADNSYSYSLYYAFTAYMRANNGNITTAQNFVAGDTDFSTQIMKMLESNPDVLFCPNYTGELGGMIEQIRANGWEGDIVCGLDAAPVLNEQVSADDIKGVVFVSNIDLASEKIAGIWNDYAAWAKYEGATNLMKFCLGYDMANVVAYAIANGGATTQGVTEQLAALKDYEGLTGTISIGADTHQPYGLAMSIYKYNGEGQPSGYDLLVNYSAETVDYTLEEFSY